ncbi:MAG TPA: hypothetical protein VFN61_01930 [Acidimicrobiales bacterium]|nr:hypothetical protein [Acidimicrobiales bacterium]
MSAERRMRRRQERERTVAGKQAGRAAKAKADAAAEKARPEFEARATAYLEDLAVLKGATK